MTEHRCTHCNGLLLKGELVQCEIVCHKCKTKNIIDYISQKHLWHPSVKQLDNVAQT